MPSSSSSSLSCPAYTTVKYENTKTITGQGQATYTYDCAFSDAVAVRAYLLNKQDPNDSTLLCTEIKFGYKNNDIFCGKAELTATYAPQAGLFFKTLNNPFTIELDFTEESYPLAGNKVFWDEDNTRPINNKNVLASFNQVFGVLRMSGIRSTWDLSSIAGYIGYINSDYWQGADPHTLLLMPPKVKWRNDGTKNISIDIRWKPNLYPGQDGWKTIWNEEAGVFDYPTWQDGGGSWQNLYPETAFSGLENTGL